MKIETNCIKIQLEDQEEIRKFWNIIAFALDLQERMTNDEKEMANKLYDLTEPYL